MLFWCFEVEIRWFFGVLGGLGEVAGGARIVDIP